MSEETNPPAANPEDEGSKRIWWIVATVLLVLIALRFAPKIENPLRPKPTTAYVALLAEGESVASDGRHELDADRSFRLFAVLEARTFGGGSIYYTEAPALRLGGREIPAASLRPWPEDRTARVRWLTVEGSAPYLAVREGADLDRFRLVETYHAEWGTNWSARGVVEPRLGRLDANTANGRAGFGTQRFAARVEIYPNQEALTPSERWSSAHPEALLDGSDLGTSVVASLPSPLKAISGAFGRTRIELPGEVDGELRRRAEALTAEEIAYFGPALLARHLRESERAPEALEFRTVELGPDGPRWGVDVAPGDLIGVGDRQLVLWRDEGVEGHLDPADVAADAYRGLRLLRIDEVFLGEEGLRLDLAPVAERPDRAPAP